MKQIYEDDLDKSISDVFDDDDFEEFSSFNLGEGIRADAHDQIRTKIEDAWEERGTSATTTAILEGPYGEIKKGAINQAKEEASTISGIKDTIQDQERDIPSLIQEATTNGVDKQAVDDKADDLKTSIVATGDRLIRELDGIDPDNEKNVRKMEADKDSAIDEMNREVTEFETWAKNKIHNEKEPT